MKQYLLFIVFFISCSIKTEKKEIIRILEEKLTTKNEIVYYNEEAFNGISYKLWKNGKLLSERSFKNGMPDGISRGWFDNGQMMYEGKNLNGKENGKWKHWYVDGKQNMEANFVNGTLNGSLKRWFENGFLAYERIYDNGEMIEEKIPSHTKKSE